MGIWSRITYYRGVNIRHLHFKYTSTRPIWTDKNGCNYLLFWKWLCSDHPLKCFIYTLNWKLTSWKATIGTFFAKNVLSVGQVPHSKYRLLVTSKAEPHHIFALGPPSKLDVCWKINFKFGRRAMWEHCFLRTCAKKHLSCRYF